MVENCNRVERWNLGFYVHTGLYIKKKGTKIDWIRKTLHPYQTPHHTLTFAEPWQTNIYHHQDFYQLKQIWSTQLFPYIFILTEKHIKLTKHIWKQSSMYSISQKSSPSGQNKIVFPKLWTNRSHEK